MATQQAGIIVTQAGVSVPYAADYQMVFNSNWPSIQTAFDQTITIAPSSTNTLSHNLGFFPLVMAWSIVNGVSKGRIFSVSENFESSAQVDVSYTFDQTNIYLTNSSLSTTYTVNVKCYNLDISTNVDYALPKPALIKTQYDPTYGIKVNKNGKSIASTDLRDFILHSRAQSPAVLSVKAGSSGTGGGLGQNPVYYQNPAGYIPWILAFVGTSNNTQYYSIAPGTQQSGAAFYIGSLNSLISGANGSGGIINSLNANTNLSLVVLRDPLIVPTSFTVTYNGSAISG